MFDLDAGKLVIVGVAALVFIPAKDLPRVLRQAGQFVGKMRRMANEFQGQFMDAMREADMADLRREAQKLAESARVETGLGSIGDLNRDIARPLDRKPPEDTPAAMGRVDANQTASHVGTERAEAAAGSAPIAADGTAHDRLDLPVQS